MKPHINSRGAMRGYSLAERFWAKVEKGADDECWLWAAFKERDGYGFLQLGRRALRANRVSWMIHFGAIPEGQVVCHRCGNPSCVNPAHLFLGTNAENTADSTAKGRRAKGERQGSAKLCTSAIVAIRHLYQRGVLQVDIAREFGIHQTAVSGIVRRKAWSHV